MRRLATFPVGRRDMVCVRSQTAAAIVSARSDGGPARVGRVAGRRVSSGGDGVVPALDVLEDRAARLRRGPRAAVDELAHRRVVETPRPPRCRSSPRSTPSRPRSRPARSALRTEAPCIRRIHAVVATLDREELQLGKYGGLRIVRAERRCARRDVRGTDAGSIGSGSGQRSPAAGRARQLAWSRCLGGGSRPMVSGGWRDAVGRPGRRCRDAACRLPSGRRSPSCAPAGAGSARSRVSSVARRRRSRGRELRRNAATVAVPCHEGIVNSAAIVAIATAGGCRAKV